MKPEIAAAAEFLSRIFLAHDNITKEKVSEFKQHLSEILEERFRDHWHETCPTKGQAYRCIRVCPDEPLDPVLEKVCAEVGINAGDFNLPFELTLWVDPTEVVCKFGDLKCSYHTVAKKDITSGSLDNQAQHLDIDDIVENARDLYLKKQTVIIHPVHSTEMHISNPYSDGSNNLITMAIRINGTMHYNASGSPPPGYDGSPRGKGKPTHTGHHKRGGGGGYHYYGKSSGGKGTYLSNGTINTGGTHITSAHHGYQHHRNHNHHHPHHHHGSNGQHAQTMTSAYSNGYLNGYGDENGYGYDHQAGSPTKMMGMSGMPQMSSTGGPGQITQSSPTPEQIQQQMQHPPPLPPHIHQAFGHPPADTSTLPPPPSTLPQQQSSSSTAVSTTSSSGNISSVSGSGKPSTNGSNSSKYQGNRGNVSSRNKQSSPVKEVK